VRAGGGHAVQPSVLVVEDDFLIAAYLEGALAEDGWRVLGPAASVAQALTLLEAETPAVAVLDVSLNGEFVTRVAERLRVLRVPFALASALHNPARVGGAVLAGAPNLGKPTDLAQLKRTVASLAGVPREA
jgi:two-component system, response regulator PdtaR